MVTDTTGGRPIDSARQDGFAYRFEWGAEGLAALAPHVDVAIIVDVLRFTSAVSAAIEAGATVFPYRWADAGAAEYARSHDAALAGMREDGGPSLSPTDLLRLRPGVRLVLPSPNGSALSFAARELGVHHVLAGSLRNATATAVRAKALAGRSGAIAVVAAGERWDSHSGPLRPAVEDLIGAGAVLAALDPSVAVSPPCSSPEALAARAAFLGAKPRLYESLAASASGRQLAGRGWDDDVHTSAALDVSAIAVELSGEEFRAVTS